MEVKIEKENEVVREAETTKKQKLYNPGALDFSLKHRLKSIELSDDCTRIDFIYRAPTLCEWRMDTVGFRGVYFSHGVQYKISSFACHWHTYSPNKALLQARRRISQLYLDFSSVTKKHQGNQYH